MTHLRKIGHYLVNNTDRQRQFATERSQWLHSSKYEPVLFSYTMNVDRASNTYTADVFIYRKNLTKNAGNTPGKVA